MTLLKAKHSFHRMGWIKKLSWLILVPVIIYALYGFFSIKSGIEEINYALTPPELPAYTPAEKTEYLDQDWSEDQSQWFHHASQGTGTIPIPYDWFVALEQPESTPWLLLFGEEDAFIADDYILRMGFIQGTQSANNPDVLPVGFAKTDNIYFQGIDKQATAVGFTCAACHTSHYTYDNIEYIVNGGPAQTDLNLLTKSLGAALGQTALSSKLSVLNGRFKRFADKVLGENNNPLSQKELKQQLIDTIGLLAKTQDTIDVTEGFSRLDALTRIGNQVFARNLDRNENYTPIFAPVNYPHIWTTSWFDWVQYDGSIMQPLIRNTGEALGVKAHSNTTAPFILPSQEGLAISEANPNHQRFASSIPVENLFKIESLLAGKNPSLDNTFSGLLAPSWPASMPKIDHEKAQKGKALYGELCQSCHLPTLDSADIWNHFETIKYQKDTALGIEHIETPEKYLALNIIPISTIGTDPSQASVLTNRTVDTTGLGLETEVCTQLPQNPANINNEQYSYKNDAQPLAYVPFSDSPTLNFGLALGAYVQETNDQWFEQNYIPTMWRSTYEGNRPNCLQVAQGYKARPLNGIWATAPFLHNGSIATLYDLLSPFNERPRYVQLGSTQFDVDHVGIQQDTNIAAQLEQNEPPADYINGVFILNTQEMGNLNTGHEFDASFIKGSKNKKGVIGPELAPAQREALVEYLKTL
jgi:hypothetical protein